LWRFDNTIIEFWAYFSLRMRRNAYELPVKNLTSPFASVTPISCNSGITLLSEYICAIFWRFL